MCNSWPESIEEAVTGNQHEETPVGAYCFGVLFYFTEVLPGK